MSQQPYQYGVPSMAPQKGPSLGWGPQFGPGQGWQPQLPPKKPSKGPLVAILGLCLVGVVAAFVVGMMQKNANDNYSAPKTSEPSWRVTSPMPTPTGNLPTEPSPTEPTASEPTASEPTASEPTSTPTTTKPDDLAIVARNKLYTTEQARHLELQGIGMRPGRPPTRTRRSTGRRSSPASTPPGPARSRSADRSTGSRMMTYWSGTTVSTPCSGGGRTVPFYCSANHMMYMKVDAFVKVYNQYPDAESKAYARMWYTRSIAHEYGHAVQSMTGILQAAHQLRYEATSYNDRMLMSRRIELQANCFAGVFLAVNKSSYPIDGLLLKTWNKWVVTVGDPPNKGDHGSAASNVRFMGKAFTTGTPGTCNTFAASPENVS